MRVQTIVVSAGALALVAVALFIAKKGWAGAAAAVTTAAVDVAAGTVVGIGQAIGIPATNETECAKAKREGRTLDASFACPAGEFISWSIGGLFASEGAAPQGGATGSW